MGGGRLRAYTALAWVVAEGGRAEEGGGAEEGPG